MSLILSQCVVLNDNVLFQSCDNSLLLRLNFLNMVTCVFDTVSVCCIKRQCPFSVSRQLIIVAVEFSKHGNMCL